MNNLTLPSYLTPLTHLWNSLFSVACFALSVNIFSLDNFGNLGRPVQYFVGSLVLLPIFIIIYLTLGLISKENQDGKPQRFIPRYSETRYGLMIFYFIGMALAFAVLVHNLRLFDGLEFIVTTILNHTWLLLGFVIAYALFWVSGRMNERNTLKPALSRFALMTGGLTVLAIIFLSDFFTGMSVIISGLLRPDALVITVAMIIFGVLTWGYLKSGEYFGETPQQRTSWQGWLMLAPNILGFMIFFAGPLLLSLYLSFTDNTVGQVPNFIALENYGRLFSLEFQTQTNLDEAPQKALSFGYRELGFITLNESRLVIGARDPIFWLSLRNTILFCLLLVPLAVIPAIGLALVLNSSLPGVKIFRAIYFLPSVAAVVGTALIWRWLYNPSTGYFNYIIGGIVEWLNTTLGMQIADPKIQWLSDPSVVMFSMVLLAAWQNIGYNTVLFLAGLQGIPRELYEAAMIDGATRWKQFTNVTMPMLAPTTFFVLVTTINTGLQVFNEPYTLFPSIPIPTNATTVVYHLYQQGFGQFQFGYASAVAWFLFVIIFGITYIQFRYNRSDAY